MSSPNKKPNLIFWLLLLLLIIIGLLSMVYGAVNISTDEIFSAPGKWMHQSDAMSLNERIFMGIWTRCKPIKLTVYARYTRRGGLDINPFRTSHPQALPVNSRNARQ